MTNDNKSRNPLDALREHLEILQASGAIGGFTVITLDDGPLLRVARGNNSPADVRAFLMNALDGLISRVEIVGR